MAPSIQHHIVPLSDDLARAMSQPSHRPDEAVFIAQLLTIDISRLEEGDEAEAAKLFKASKEDGAFYLDFSNHRDMGMLEAVENVFAISKEIFDLSEEEKLRYDVDLLGSLKLNGWASFQRIPDIIALTSC